MDLGIKDRLALVTGASKGIGRVIALELAKEGARVVAVARTEDTLKAVHKEMGGPAGRHHFFAMDLTAPGGVPKLVEALGKLGSVDIMVHNLGGSMGVLKAMAPVEDWEKVWHFNLGVGHELNRALIPGMVERKWGRIVHLSALSTTTYNGYSAYVSAKCAIDGYVKSVSREFSKHNVSITAVSPGAIYSEGRHFAKISKENPAALEEYFNQHLPIRRLGLAEDVAPVVAFLCGERAGFLAGGVYDIHGGGN